VRAHHEPNAGGLGLREGTGRHVSRVTFIVLMKLKHPSAEKASRVIYLLYGNLGTQELLMA
jgi:hypothetical protein